MGFGVGPCWARLRLSGFLIHTGRRGSWPGEAATRVWTGNEGQALTASMSTTRRGGVPVVQVRGELGDEAGSRLRSLVYDQIAVAPLVVVDLSGVPAAELRALGALAMVSHAAAKMGHQVRVAGAGPAVRELALASGTALGLSLHRDVPAALSGTTDDEPEAIPA
jgi:anti-anti-sigma regulatory factor